MGGGRVQFGGRIGFDGYVPGELNVTVRGEGMQLRYPGGRPLDGRRRPDGARQRQGADARRHGDRARTRSGRRADRRAGGAARFRGRRAVRPPGRRAGPPPPRRCRCASTSRSWCRRRCGSRTTWPRLVASADLQLRGTYDRPMLFGRAEVERGEVTFEGQRYRVTQGHDRLHQPDAHRAVLRHRGRNARPRAGPDLPRHRRRRRHDAEAACRRSSSDPPLPAADVLALLFSDVRRDRGRRAARAAESEPAADATSCRRARREMLASPISRSRTRRASRPSASIPSSSRRPSSIVNSHAGVAAEPVRPGDDRQAHLGPRLPDVFAQPDLVDQRPDHPARVRRKRPPVVDSVAQRGLADLRPRVPREARLLMRWRTRAGGRTRVAMRWHRPSSSARRTSRRRIACTVPWRPRSGRPAEARSTTPRQAGRLGPPGHRGTRDDRPAHRPGGRDARVASR